MGRLPDAPPPRIEVRSCRVGWVARYVSPGWVTSSVWRPTQTWAVRVARRIAARNDRRNRPWAVVHESSPET